MGIFSNVKKYAEAYQLIKEEALTQEEIDNIIQCDVAPGMYKNAIAFISKTDNPNENEVRYITLDESQQEVFYVGDKIDPKRCFLRLLKKGDTEIIRVIVK